MTHILALIGILAISFSAIFVRLADTSPATATFFRMAYAVPVLAVWWQIVHRRAAVASFRRGLAFICGIVLAVDLSLWHWSIGLIGAGLSTVLANVQVVFVGVFAWVLHGERPSGRAVATVPLILLGVALITGLGRPDAYGSDPILGAVLGAAAGVCYATFLILFRASNRNLVPPSGPLLYATAGAAVTTLMISPLDPGFSISFTWPVHGWLLALALLPQVFGWVLIARALPRLPALETSVLLLMQPMLTVLWSLLIFAEALSGVQWSGVLLVLGGITFLTLRGGAVRPVRAPAEP
jgi:drug/metabolite transporter (DMT)-like permease